MSTDCDHALTSPSPTDRRPLVEHFAPWLEQRGFRRRHGTFRRRRDEAWQILNFQRHRYSNAGLVRFTINVGASLDVLHEKPAVAHATR